MRVKPSPRGRRGPRPHLAADGAPGAAVAGTPVAVPSQAATDPPVNPLGRPGALLAGIAGFWPVLSLIALGALALRLYGLNWDANNHLHPDERAIVFAAMCLTFPAQAALRLGSCAAAATGPGWLLSPNSPLNPHFFAYGSFPMYLLAAVCHGLAWLTTVSGGRFVPSDGGAWDDFNHFTLVGRALSALFDTGSVVIIGLMGRRLASPRVALLAAALVAVIPFEIQVAHFSAVDTVLTFFVLLTLLGCLRLAQGPAIRSSPRPEPLQDKEQPDERPPGAPLAAGWGAWGVGLFIGLALGLALASKVSALPLLAPVGLAVLLRWRRRGWDEASLAVLGICGATILAFLVTSPYALIDWNSFQQQVNEQTALSRGQLDFPYVRQFTGTTPYLYQIQQLLLYDMGLPLGLLGLAGAIWAGWRVWRRWDDDWLIVVAWLLLYFAIVGGAYTKFTRYMVPLFPLLALCGAAALGALASGAGWIRARQGEPAAGVSAWGARVARWLAALVGARGSRALAVGLGLIVLGASTFMALALDNIYSTPNTRMQASEWIYDHVPAGATVTSEIWDESQPFLIPAARTDQGIAYTAAGHPIEPGQYVPVGLDLYQPDTPEKATQLAQQVAGADVVVINSQRLLRTIPRMPDRYPMTTRYYQLLFAGRLGLTLAAHFENSPHLLGWTLPEGGADESFSVYDHPPVWIFTRQGAARSADDLRAVLTAGLALPAASNRSGSQKSLLLTPADVAANAQSRPLAVQFPPNSLANRAPLFWWLLLVELLGVFSFPLTYLAFPGLRDRGWGLSKLLGLLLLAYGVWLPASLRVLPFEQSTVVGAFALLAAAGGGLAWWRRGELWALLRARWRLLAIGEGGFLLAFGYFTWVRALDPDLWHIWRGGEKPMELAFLNAILRSRYVPPVDPWFSGGHINYYYYGQFLIATLIRLTGVAPTTAFNLAIPLLFAVSVSAAFSLVAGLTGRWWAGLAGGVALVVVGNLDGAAQAIGQWQQALAHRPVPPFDYWQSSRVIPFTINEFPYWSFLYADLHAHLIDIPVVVLVVAACASLLVTRRGRWRTSAPTLAVATLALGATACINTWDFPTSALLVGATLAIRELVDEGASWSQAHARVWAGWKARWPRLAERALWLLVGLGLSRVAAVYVMFRPRLTWPVLRRLGASLALAIGGAYILYLPFHAHFQSFVSGVAPVAHATDPRLFVTVFGLWLFLVATFFVVELRDRWERHMAVHFGHEAASRAPRRLWQLTLLAAVVLALAYAAGVKTLLVMLLAAGFYLALNPRHPPLKLMTYALALLGLAVALGVELIYVRDFLDGSDWERMNTVFKFYYQVWEYLALSGALAFAQLAPRIFPAGEHDATLAGAIADGDVDAAPPPDTEDLVIEDDLPASASGMPDWSRRLPEITGVWLLRTLWLAAFLALLAGSLVFLVEGTAARVQDPALWAAVQPPPGGVQPPGLSLDGMAYMRGWYPDDYEAITWMNAHLAGAPTIIEASNGPYRWYGRVSIYTGLPSVVGWSSHESQQRYPDAVFTRQGDVQLFYTTVDPQAAADILHRYDVRYVYVGGLERDCPTAASDPAGSCLPASPGAIQKYATLVHMGILRPVHEYGAVTIYEVVR